MSVREQLNELTAALPDYKLAYVLAYVQGLIADETTDQADDAYCEQLLKNYQENPDPHKHDAVPLEELDSYKKEFGRKRRTVVENAEEAVFEEKKIEEQQVVFLMDRFGYAKTVDTGDTSLHPSQVQVLSPDRSSPQCLDGCQFFSGC